MRLWLNRFVLFWFEKSFWIHLLVSTVVTDGLVDNMAPGFFFAVLMIFGFALFVVDRVAFFNPFSFGYCYLVFAAFLTLNFFDLAYHRNCYWIAYLKKSSNQISFSFLPSKILLPVHNVHNNIAADIRFRILVNNNLGRDNHICLCQKLLKKMIAFFSNSHFFSKMD